MLYIHDGLLFVGETEATYKDLLRYLFQNGLVIRRRPRAGFKRPYTEVDFADSREHLRMLKVSNVNILKVVCYNVFSVFGHDHKDTIVSRLKDITVIGSSIEVRDGVLWNISQSRSLSLQEMIHYGILNFGWPVALSRPPYLSELIKINTTIKKWDPNILVQLCKPGKKRYFEMHRGFITALFCLSYVAQIEFIRTNIEDYLEYYKKNENIWSVTLKKVSKKRKKKNPERFNLKESNINILKVICYNVFCVFGHKDITARLNDITVIGSFIDVRDGVLWNIYQSRSLSFQEMIHYGILNFDWPVTLSRPPYLGELMKIKKWDPVDKKFEMHRGFITALFCLSYVAKIEFIQTSLKIEEYLEYYKKNENTWSVTDLEKKSKKRKIKEDFDLIFDTVYEEIEREKRGE
jgi:hypothetical protein